MELTQEQIETLRGYKTYPDNDTLRIKDRCRKSLISDPLILYLLNNEELEAQDADPTEYINRNILNNFLIHPTIHNVKNFICLGCGFEEGRQYNQDIKRQKIFFYILCDEKTNIEPLTGFGRHDLIAARIIDIFNYTNIFGTQCFLIEDSENTTDNDYATRTLTFIMDTPKNIVKTTNGVSKIINNIGR